MFLRTRLPVIFLVSFLCLFVCLCWVTEGQFPRPRPRWPVSLPSCGPHGPGALTSADIKRFMWVLPLVSARLPFSLPVFQSFSDTGCCDFPVRSAELLLPLLVLPWPFLTITTRAVGSPWRARQPSPPVLPCPFSSELCPSPDPSSLVAPARVCLALQNSESHLMCAGFLRVCH